MIINSPSDERNSKTDKCTSQHPFNLTFSLLWNSFSVLCLQTMPTVYVNGGFSGVDERFVFAEIYLWKMQYTLIMFYFVLYITSLVNSYWLIFWRGDSQDKQIVTLMENKDKYIMLTGLLCLCLPPLKYGRVSFNSVTGDN